MGRDRVSRGPIRRPELALSESGGWVHITTQRSDGWCSVYYARLLRWSMHEADSPHRSDLLVRGSLAFGCWAHLESEHASTRPWTWCGGTKSHDFYADRWGRSEGCRCIVITECRGGEAKILRAGVRKLWRDWGLDNASAPLPPYFRAPPATWTQQEPANRPVCPIFLPAEPIAELTSATASARSVTTVCAWRAQP